MKQVQVLQHVPFEGLGSIAAWLAAQRAVSGRLLRRPPPGWHRRQPKAES